MTTQSASGNGQSSHHPDAAHTGPRATWRDMVAMVDQVFNATFSRPYLSRVLGLNPDRRRNLYDECGYPQTEAITFDHYREMYDREPVAARVVELLPQESWATQPTVYETEDADTVTPFEEAWDALGKSLGGAGYYQSEEGNPIWEYLLRADIQSGIGRYGAVLLGLDDGKPLEEPAEGIDEKGQKSGNAQGRRLIYLRALNEGSAQIVETEKDQQNPRYGQPVRYSVIVDAGEASQRTIPVHWSRIIHISESEVYGAPRMLPVYNQLYDIQKVGGSAGEMYYKGAFPGFALETDPSLLLAGAKVSFDETTTKDQMENWMNGLQRYLFLKGQTLKNLGTQVVDPTPQVMLFIKLICIRLGVPERIFMGSERGELASSQDKNTWNQRLTRRQHTYLTPRLIVPFVDRLILVGALPEPAEYFVDWPDLQAMSDLEKADLAIRRTDAMVKYVQGNVESLVAPLDFLTRVLPYTEEEATAMLEAADTAVEERVAEEAEAAQEAAKQQPPNQETQTDNPPRPGETQDAIAEM